MPKLTKAERLSGKSTIDRLFKEGRSFAFAPFRVIWLLSSTPTSSAKVSVLVTVPKRSFRKAVDRNLIKRRVKEAYRLNKNIVLPVLSANSDTLMFALVFTGKEIPDFETIQSKILLILQRLEMIIQK